MHISQWNRIANPEIDPRKYDWLMFDKGARATNGRVIFFSISGAGTIEYPLQKET